MHNLVTIRMILAFTNLTLQNTKVYLSHFEEHRVYLFSEAQNDDEKEIEVK